MYETRREPGRVVVYSLPILLVVAYPNKAVGRSTPLRQRDDAEMRPAAIFEVLGIVGVEVYDWVALGVFEFALNERYCRRPLLLSFFGGGGGGLLCLLFSGLFFGPLRSFLGRPASAQTPKSGAPSKAARSV